MPIHEDTVLVILGASGDLAKKKLACLRLQLYLGSAYANGVASFQRCLVSCLLPEDFKVIGFAPDQLSHEDFIGIVRAPIKLESPRFAEQLKQFCARCSYVSGHEGGDASFKALQRRLEEIGHGRKEQHRLFYLSLPPSIFTMMSENLKRFCYPERGTSRIIIEKPFGHDLESSRELQRSLDPNWREDEIFRVDHYLGKEVVNNLLVLRFGNEIFGAIWNRDHIDSVQISITEGKGAEGRGSYFNSTGVIRDVMQNHMIQILALLTMERPKSFAADDLRAEKVRVLETTHEIKNEETIIGQYSKSTDDKLPAFKDEEDVPDDTRCATFCAAIARIENERWTGVPFILKAGKALSESKTEILINFKASPNSAIFPTVTPNHLTIRIQPNEGVFLTINTFVPTLTSTKISAMDLDLTYHGREVPEAYEALLVDALGGDFSRSVRGDEVDASWRVWTPLLHYLDGSEGERPRTYAYGSTGPEGVDEFVEGYVHKRET